MDKQIEQLVDYLNHLNQLPETELESFPELEIAVAKFYKKCRKRQRRANGKLRKQDDRETVKQIAKRRLEEPNQVQLQDDLSPTEFKHKSRTCYSCNTSYRTVHPHYHWLCTACGDLCAEKRKQTADLTGYRAIVTGGRIKIGFQTALWLLRCGADVHVTTRFPVDAAIRFSHDPEFESFEGRLKIHGIDFRNIPALLHFINEFKRTHECLHILVNNAAQSVKRSQQWHERLMDAEQNTKLLDAQQRLIASMTEVPTAPLAKLNSSIAEEIANGKSMSTIESNESALTSIIDDDDRLDLREKNTWNSDLLETEPLEILESLLVNSNAPTVLTRGLFPLLKTGRSETFVVNVVGADSMFSLDKSGYHPHVNMSKAALNMLTHSCAKRFSVDNVIMNSVDTGWITHEGGYSNRKRLESIGFTPPYDHLDGAARILDPIFQVVSKTSEPQPGILFRNFKPFSW